MKNTDPLLVSVTLPTSTGTASVPTNLGKQTTKGYTLSANVVVLQKEELNWSINGNLRHLKYEYKNIGKHWKNTMHKTGKMKLIKRSEVQI